MKIRPQMVLSLAAVGCVALAGVHFATAQQATQRQGTQKIQRPDSAQQQQRDARQRTDGRSDSKTRIDSKQRTTVRSSTKTSIIRSSVFIGAPVSISGGVSLGTVQDVVLSDGGCVDFVIVNYDNRLVPVPWMAGTFRADDRAFLLTLQENQLAQLPTFTDFAQLSDTTFVTKVNTFYKVDERSRDRRNDRDGRDNKGRDDKGKADSGKSQRDANSKQPAKSRDAAPRTEKKSDAPAGDQNRSSESKQNDSNNQNDSPSTTPAPKQDPAKKATEK